MFVSEYLGLNSRQFDVFVDLGVFDASLDKDSHFFINVIRLKKTEIPEFAAAYKHLNKHFSDLATLLNVADVPSEKDKMYRAAKKASQFHEVNGINLGFAKSQHGAGWGEALIEQFLQDAYEIVKKGSMQPELFHLVGIFEDNVGGDRVSDMIATIIEPEIKKYTLRIMGELGLSRENCSHLVFREDGLIQNPFKKAPILLLPMEILHKLPIAKNWDDVDTAAFENNIIRQEINIEIGTEWEKWAAADKKRYFLQNIFMNPEACERVIAGYKKEDLTALDFSEDADYIAELLLKKTKLAVDFSAKESSPSSFDAAMHVIGILKDWVENNRGWAEIQNVSTQTREKAVQKYMHLGAKDYVKTNNIDISFEPNEGRGPVDIKLSRGNDKTLVEIKLSSNSQYLHGYETQLKEYGAAEQTENLIYVLLDVGNPERVKKITEIHNNNLEKGIECPELVIIDAKARNAASTFELPEKAESTDC